MDPQSSDQEHLHALAERLDVEPHGGQVLVIAQAHEARADDQAELLDPLRDA